MFIRKKTEVKPQISQIGTDSFGVGLRRRATAWGEFTAEVGAAW